jgi:threonine dehydratase
VPPFDHPWIIAGQGTCGLEIAEDAPDVSNVLVCTGGGGLLAGIAIAISELCPKAQIIGVDPELAADATESFYKGERISWSAQASTRTIADGVRTQQLGQYTFDIIKEKVHGFVTVSEEEIIKASKWYLEEAKLVVEPTGALTLAAYHKLKQNPKPLPLKPGKTVVLLSGGNADSSFLKSLL